MPIKLIRLFVAMSMAFLVPLQGIAAATAGLCMAFGHHQSATDGHDHASAEHQDVQEHHDSGADGNSDQAHCPPCVACCAAAAISSSERVFAPEAPAALVVGVIPPAFSGIQPETLDRPPLAL